MKKRYYILGLLLLSIMFTQIQCEDCYGLYGVFYVNNADYDVYLYISDGFSNAYPNTTIFFNDKNMKLIKRQEQIGVGNRFPLEEIIKSLPSDTLSIFYIHSDTLRKYSWEIIQCEYKILQRYDLSIIDIDKLKNEYGIPVIPYPPTETMKNMKMYPPYKKSL